MDKSRYYTIIIGGGASGAMLAASLDLAGRRGIILEKTHKMGTKLLMSGGGRCNITHGGSIKDFVLSYGDAGPMLRKCLYRHSNLELASWLEDHGVALADERGNAVASYDIGQAGRVFPASMRSSEVLDAFTMQANKNGWETLHDADVYSLIPPAADGEPWTVKTSQGSMQSDNVVLATGGITFPETGSDGSMFGVIRGLGITVNDVRSALAPIYVRDYPYTDLSGISIPDVTVTAFSSDAVNTCKGKAARMKGDILFTHRGFSGPVILNISKYAEPGELLRIQYGKPLEDLPKRLRAVLEDRSRGPSGDIRSKQLASYLDRDDFIVTSVDENGMVTSGGISLDEIDTQTMQLRKLQGLFAIGEVIDADGITGGYNLQMCWSTARTVAQYLS